MRLPRVAVSAAGSRSGLAAIRDLGRAGHPVVGLDREPPPFGLRSRWSEPYRRLPLPTDAATLLRLLAEARAEALLPMESALVGLVAAAAAPIGRELAVCVPDAAAFEAAYDNRLTIEACHRLGIPAPRLLARREVNGPVVVKPREDIGGGAGVIYCRGPDALEQALAACSAWGHPLIQEHIPGGSSAMRTVVVLLDRGGRLAAHFTARKLRTWPSEGGITTASISTEDPGLVRQVMPLLEEWRWRGPAEVELKVDPRDGRAKVIEVNPRLPGYLAFPIACGLHLPRLAIEAALGRVTTPARYAAGRVYVNLALHLRSLLADRSLPGGRLARLSQGLAACGAARAAVLEGLRDPAPRLGKALQEMLGTRPGLVPARGGPGDH